MPQPMFDLRHGAVASGENCVVSRTAAAQVIHTLFRRDSSDDCKESRTVLQLSIQKRKWSSHHYSRNNALLNGGYVIHA